MKTKMTVAALVIAAISLMFVVKVHFIRDEDGGGDILWKNNVAYLFMADNPIGYRISILGYLLEPIKEHFYAPAMSEDDKLTLSIIRVTPAGAERHDQESTVGIWALTPIDGEIYAHCAGGVCRWTGTRFQLLSDQEEQGMAGEARLSKGDFANIDGWSRRGINATRAGRDHNQAEFSIDLGGQINILVGEGNPVTVDLVRPDHTPERVWYHEQGTRRVSAAEYQRVFRPTN